MFKNIYHTVHLFFIFLLNLLSTASSDGMGDIAMGRMRAIVTDVHMLRICKYWHHINKPCLVRPGLPDAFLLKKGTNMF